MRRSAAQEILFELLPDRRLRSNPRVVKRKMSSFPLKRARHREWPQPTKAPAEVIELGGRWLLKLTVLGLAQA